MAEDTIGLETLLLSEPRGVKEEEELERYSSSRPSASNISLMALPASTACSNPRGVSGTCGSGMYVYACESTLPSDSAWRTRTIRRGRTRRSRGVAEELVEWKRASNSPRALASRAGGMMTVGEGGGEEGGEVEGVEVAAACAAWAACAACAAPPPSPPPPPPPPPLLPPPLPTSLVARAKATASPEAALLAAAFLASASALESSLAVSAWSLATSSCRRSSCAERASSSATSAGVSGRDWEEEGEELEPLPLDAAPVACFSDCAGGGLATCSLVLLPLLPPPEEGDEEAAAAAATEEATDDDVRRWMASTFVGRRRRRCRRRCPVSIPLDARGSARPLQEATPAERKADAWHAIGGREAVERSGAGVARAREKGGGRAVVFFERPAATTPDANGMSRAFVQAAAASNGSLCPRCSADEGIEGSFMCSPGCCLSVFSLSLNNDTERKRGRRENLL